jgi:hypothetical protein
VIDFSTFERFCRGDYSPEVIAPIREFLSKSFVRAEFRRERDNLVNTAAAALPDGPIKSKARHLRLHLELAARNAHIGSDDLAAQLMRRVFLLCGVLSVRTLDRILRGTNHKLVSPVG